ncbi:hypothetical protein ACP70R_001805 [Stipagrostis hirtigluma subsp. patula]
MKGSAVGQLVLVLLACTSVHAVTWSSIPGNETDRLSLLEFKKGIILDPHQALVSWNDSTHFCNWEGVLCRKKNPRRVTSLDLGYRGLVGHIPPSLGNLTHMKHLFLAANSFIGQIPASIGQLRRLETLFLSNNTLLQGNIPSFANCSNLKVLWLDGNNLAGGFPDLPLGLQQLQLSANNLAGTIPSSIGNITGLQIFTSAFNHIEGNIPNEFAKLSELQILYAGGNRLTGRFPQTVLNLSTLVHLALNTNNLSGELPHDLGSSLPNLQLLAIASNLFHGNIPYSLVNASNLNLIGVSNNKFTGVVPSSIGKLAKLTRLNLERNKLQARSEQDWEFMVNLANSTELNTLSLAGNQLEGPVPDSLGNLSIQLQYLYLGHNQLSGGFPSGIANLHNLIDLQLGCNQFTGVVPEWLGSLKRLQQLSLSTNMFTGSIPTSLSNLSQLAQLLLDTNQFTGKIPPNLGNLQTLTEVNISNNNLSGRIPREIFGIPTIAQIRLSFNNLDGQIPADVGLAKQLMHLDLSTNKLSGDIPSTLGNCESLEDIELHNNVFSGSIPSSLGDIRTLKVLNLSHNNITGSIPTSLGNLQLLEHLDLSFNQLEGEVPVEGIFKNATAVRIDGNKELCGGPLEFNLPACSVMPHKPSVVMEVVIPLAIVVSLAGIFFVLLICWRGEQKIKSNSSPTFGGEFPRISYSDLVRATDGFSVSNLIGKGRYSSVYQGKLFQNENVVAIKVFGLETRGALKSFVAECNALRSVRHRNIVPILTACSCFDSNGYDFKALVYQFMPRGDLHNLLYMTQDSGTSYVNYISLAQRLRIVIDISEALSYLHHNHHGTIVHCDLKPSNILLDDNMVAHLGDFGLAKFKFDTTSSLADSNSLAIQGTIGYVAPECVVGSHVSTAADVYSFGVVLLEIFIRRTPTDAMFKDGMNIAKFVEINYPDKVLQIADPQLLQELDLSNKTLTAAKDGVKCLQSMLNIGLRCTKSSPSERISMQELSAKLHRIRDAYLTGN